MKTPTRKQVVQALVLAGSVLATSSFALTIPGLQQTPRGEPYASASIENNNVVALQILTPQAVEKQLEPYLPAGQSMQSIAKGVTPLLPAGIGRKQVIVVEPVFIHDTPDAAASGNALSSALQTARTKSYRVLVYVDSGTYEVDSTGLTLPANVTLMGAGISGTIIKAPLMSSAASNLRSLTLQVPLLTISASAVISHVAVVGQTTITAGDVTLAQVRLNNDNGNTLMVSGASHLTLTDSTLTAKGDALSITRSVTGDVRNTRLQGIDAVHLAVNTPLTFVNDVLVGATNFTAQPKPAQHCYGNVGAQATPFPDAQSAITNSCISLTPTQLQQYFSKGAQQ